MKAAILTVLSVFVIALLPVADAAAHGRAYRGHTHISFGFGYPYYRPYSYYYPRSYIGFRVWPTARRYREKSDRRRSQTQMKQLYVYPAAGQSEEQLANDRYDCHVWSTEQTGHDPTLSTGDREQAEAYSRAFSACMEARDYVVK